MKKRNLIIIIILMLVTFSGFIVLQGYWINKNVSLKEENFKKSIDLTISDVIYKTEKLEAVKRIRQKMNQYRQGTRLARIIDSIDRAYNRELERNAALDSTFPAKNVFNKNKDKINVIVLQEQDTSVVTITKRGESQSQWQIFSGNPGFNYMRDSNSSKQMTKLEKAIDRFLYKTDLVNDVFDDMFNIKHYDAIENRLNLISLDSMIGAELFANDIYISYEIGVYSPLRNVLISEKTGRFHKELLEDGYKYNLFPRDFSPKPDYLLIYFPHRESYLLSQMMLMLSISAILLIVMGGVFAYSIFNIIKQKRLSEIKNDFINNMTHEFKTPISTIALACEAINDKDLDVTPQLKTSYLNLINEENKRLGAMAEKILQTAILDRGQISFKFELIDLHKVLNEVIKNYRIQVHAKDGEIFTEFEAKDSHLRADKTHITGVFINILDNANKYTPAQPVIKVKTRNLGKGIMIFIEDNGIGISKQNQKKVFDKFHRVHTGNVHDVKGFGLGLFYVKTVVTAHGGSIELESEMKKGTRIKIFLPFENKKTANR